MRIARRDMLFPMTLGACLLALPAAAASQARFPASSPHPVILMEAYLDVPGLLLTQPRGYDLVRSPHSERETRMEAYREFERRLGVRMGTSASREERSRARARLLSDLSGRLQRLPFAQLIHHGRALWERIEETTDLDVEGYRVRLLVDEAVEGKLALKVQKRLR